MGKEVEKEHIDDEKAALKITLDHLAEIKDSPLGYYTGLKLLEKLMEKLIKLDKSEADKIIEQFKKLTD